MRRRIDFSPDIFDGGKHNSAVKKILFPAESVFRRGESFHARVAHCESGMFHYVPMPDKIIDQFIEISAVFFLKIISIDFAGGIKVSQDRLCKNGLVRARMFAVVIVPEIKRSYCDQRIETNRIREINLSVVNHDTVPDRAKFGTGFNDAENSFQPRGLRSSFSPMEAEKI